MILNIFLSVGLQEMCCGADELQRPGDLKRIALDKGFSISENQGLGNCMFYAMVEQLQVVRGVEISHEELRVNLVQFLKENCYLVSMVFHVTLLLCQIFWGP